MNTFTDWDIVRNLLLAARWTVLLSLTASICRPGPPPRWR